MILYTKVPIINLKNWYIANNLFSIFDNNYWFWYFDRYAKKKKEEELYIEILYSVPVDIDQI